MRQLCLLISLQILQIRINKTELNKEKKGKHSGIILCPADGYKKEKKNLQFIYLILRRNGFSPFRIQVIGNAPSERPVLSSWQFENHRDDFGRMLQQFFLFFFLFFKRIFDSLSFRPTWSWLTQSNNSLILLDGNSGEARWFRRPFSEYATPGNV